MRHYTLPFIATLLVVLAACTPKVDEALKATDAEKEALEDELSAMDAKAVPALFAALAVAYPVLDVRDPRFDRRAYDAVLKTSHDAQEAGLPGTQALTMAVFDTLNTIDERTPYESFWSHLTAKSKMENRDGTLIEIVTLRLNRSVDDGLDLAILNQQVDELGFRETCRSDDQKPQYPRIYSVLGANGEVLANVPANSMICRDFTTQFMARCFGDTTTPAMRPACMDSFFGRVPKWHAAAND